MSRVLLLLLAVSILAVPALAQDAEEVNSGDSSVAAQAMEGPVAVPEPTAKAVRYYRLTKPLNNGKAEIDAAPTMQNVAVKGMLLYRPPRSLPLILPVRYSTAPIDMNSKPLNSTSLNA